MTDEVVTRGFTLLYPFELRPRRSKWRRWDLNPQPAALKACTPIGSRSCRLVFLDGCVSGRGKSDFRRPGAVGSLNSTTPNEVGCRDTSEMVDVVPAGSWAESTRHGHRVLVQPLPLNARPNEGLPRQRCFSHQVISLDVVPAGSWVCTATLRRSSGPDTVRLPKSM